jgi:hypothetical protein
MIEPQYIYLILALSMIILRYGETLKKIKITDDMINIFILKLFYIGIVFILITALFQYNKDSAWNIIFLFIISTIVTIYYAIKNPKEIST